MELEVEETGRFGVHTDLKIARDRRNLAVRGFARLADPERLHLPHPVGDPAQRRAGLERRRLRRGPDGRRPPLRARRRPARAGHRARGPSRQRRRRAARRLRHLRRRRGDALRARPPGLEAVLVVPREAVRTKTARAALPAEVPIADAVFNVAPRRAARPRPGARGLGPRRARPRRPPAPAAPRAPLPALDGARRAARARSARSGRRSPAPARRCSCGATTRPPRASSRRCAARPRAGRTSCACRSSPRAPTCASCS